MLFAGSVFFFGNKMTERLSDEYVKTVKAESARLPLVSLKSDTVTTGTLYGYTTEVEPCTVRGEVTVLDESDVIQVIIDERATDVRKLLYSIFDTVTGDKLDEGQISAFDVDGGTKTARIKPGITTEQGREYACELTLITSESKRVYYYFRFKKYDDAYLKEKVNYMLTFSEACRNKNIDYVIPYLESTYRGESSNHAQVDIQDSYVMVCWSELQPVVISDIKISISEIYKYIAVGSLKYMVSIDNSTGRENYLVTEKFRINLGPDHAYLLNYDRELEAQFDPELMSLTQAQLKIGVTNNPDVEMLWTKDKKTLFFVRDNVLWKYNLSENTMSKVISMRQGYATASEVCNDNTIHLLNIGEQSGLNFIVKGYINCGEYEGKIGVILYRYYIEENRLEELLYMPLSETPGHVEHEVGDFTYLNENDVFFFMAYDRIYSYNLTTGEFKEISDGKVQDGVVFCKELSYVAWQEKGDLKNIYLLYLESGKEESVQVGEGELIRLMGSIGDKLITGNGSLTDAAYYIDGSVYYPISRLRILDSSENVVKEYHEEGFYITKVEASDTSIRLTRVVKTDASGNVYTEAEDDYILIYENSDRQSFNISTRVTKDMLTEYYLTLPNGTKVEKVPTNGEQAKLTVIGENKTLRLSEHEDADHYEVYSFGKMIGVTEDFTEAIKMADTDSAVGTVTVNGKVMWERGVQNKNDDLSAETLMGAINASRDEVLNMKSLNHAKLQEMFYFIYKDIPTYAIRNDGSIILITGYDSSHVTYQSMENGKSYTERTDKLSATLENSGNIFRVDIK